MNAKGKKEKAKSKAMIGMAMATIMLAALLTLTVSPALALDWYIETADSTTNVGRYSSIALDSSGYPHISHFEHYVNDLKYTYKDASGWHTQTIDSTGDVGYYTSIALDSSGYPHISYMREYAGHADDLKYAYKDASGWHTQTIGCTEYTGTSIALDSSGYPHISYYGWGTTLHEPGLRYTYKDASGWHTQSVDITNQDVGRYSSIDLDSSEYPHISYMDYTNKKLKYAYKDASGWHTQTIDSTGDVGYYTSIALDSSGYYHISYGHSTDDFDLKYAYRDSSGWHTQTVDSGEYRGGWTSIALDSSEYPHISYMDGSNYNLMYVYKDSSGWQFKNVGNAGTKGTSIALDGSGYPHISYCTGGDTELRHAYVAENQPPVADAGPDQTAVEQDSLGGASVTLDGSGSSDPDNDPLTYSWTWAGGGSATGVNPTVSLPLGMTTITLVVNDGKVDSGPDTVDITVQDTTPPVISLVGADLQTIQCGDPYTELGATATDVCCGDLTPDIVIDDSAVDTSTVGSYTVTYDVTDCNDNPAVPVTRTVKVVDTIPPEISLLGANPQTIECGDPYTELGATATDVCCGDLTPDIVIDASAVDTSTVGSYTVTYDVTDCNDNPAVPVTRTVNVVDTTPPVISLVGADPQTIQCGDTYTELGATATDVCCGDLTPDIVIDASAVDTSTVGSYTVTYDVTDCNDNPAVPVTRTVNVVDTTPPEISVTVSPDTLWPPNHRMVDITATVMVSDICDTAPSVVLTSITSIELHDAPTSGKGKPNNDIQGAEIGTEDYIFQLRAERAAKGDGRVYTITYTVTDASGNSATASATVEVPLDM